MAVPGYNPPATPSQFTQPAMPARMPSANTPLPAGVFSLPGSAQQPQQFRYLTYKTGGLTAQQTGAQVASTFPTVKLVASFGFSNNVAVVGMSLTTSIINYDPDAAGVFLARGNRTAIDVSQGATDIYLSHITLNNSITGLNQPSSRTNSMAFANDTALRFSSSDQLSIYMCASGLTVGTILSAVLQVTYVTISN